MPESRDQDQGPSQRAGRLFWPLLLFIGLVGLAIRLYVGQHESMSYDEWQHVFMASAPRMQDLLFEIGVNAHPLFFFLLLRGLLRLGHGILLYRSISILTGVASILLTGLICRKTLRSPLLQLLCAAAFALSGTAIWVSTQARSYELAVSLVLLAFLSYLDMIPDPGKPVRLRAYVTFAIASSLAVWSLYSAVFFLGACLAAPVLLAVVGGGFRRRLISGLDKRSIWLSVLSLALPCAVFAAHIAHIRAQPIQGALYEFYWGMTPNDTLSAFLLRNSRNVLNFFSPMELGSTGAFLVTTILLGAAGLGILWKASRTKPGLKAASVVPVAFAAVIVLEFLAASLARAYPFGGMMRYQYIAAPFLLLAAFVFLDALDAIAGRVTRRGIPIFLGATIIVNPAYNWHKLIEFPDTVILSNEFADYSTAFPHARAVYVDSYTVWGYFAHTDDGRRRFVRRISGPGWIDQYRIWGGAHDGTTIFYDKTPFRLNFSDSSRYESIAACLRQSGVEEIVLFWFSPGHEPLDQDTAALKKLIGEEAAAQGLAATKVFVGETTVFAGFRLADAVR